MIPRRPGRPCPAASHRSVPRLQRQPAMRSQTLALVLLCACASGVARADNATCSANAPQVLWTVAAKNGGGTFTTVGTQELQNIISKAECECDTGWSTVDTNGKTTIDPNALYL